MNTTDPAPALHALHAHGESESTIGVVVVNYATPPEMLERTVAALLASVDAAGAPLGELAEIVVVDNDSPRWRNDAQARVEALAQGAGPVLLRWVDAGRNGGFAAGVNAGIDALGPRCRTVFLCNPDATVAPDCLYRLAGRLLAAPPSTVSVAPKMLLDLPGSDVDRPATIDAVSNAVNERGEAFNVGLGQPDLGQYDRSTPCFGPLLRGWAVPP